MENLIKLENKFVKKDRENYSNKKCLGNLKKNLVLYLSEFFDFSIIFNMSFTCGKFKQIFFEKLKKNENFSQVEIYTKEIKRCGKHNKFLLLIKKIKNFRNEDYKILFNLLNKIFFNCELCGNFYCEYCLLKCFECNIHVCFNAKNNKIYNEEENSFCVKEISSKELHGVNKQKNQNKNKRKFNNEEINNPESDKVMINCSFCKKNFCVKCFNKTEKEVNLYEEIFSGSNFDKNDKNKFSMKCFYCLNDYNNNEIYNFENDYSKKLDKISIRNKGNLFVKKCFNCSCIIDEKNSSGFLKFCGICKGVSCMKEICKLRKCLICDLSICFDCCFTNCFTSKNKIKKEKKQIQNVRNLDNDYTLKNYLCDLCARILFEEKFLVEKDF